MMAPIIGPSRSLLLAVAALDGMACTGGSAPSPSPTASRTAAEGTVGQTAWRAPEDPWFQVVSDGLDLLVVLQ